MCEESHQVQQPAGEAVELDALKAGDRTAECKP